MEAEIAFAVLRTAEVFGFYHARTTMPRALPVTIPSYSQIKQVRMPSTFDAVLWQTKSSDWLSSCMVFKNHRS